MIMKNLKAILLTVLFAVIGLSTSMAKSNELLTKDYKIKSFTSVNANTIADIVYTQSYIVSATAKGAKEMIDNLRINVDKGVLTIENDREFNNKNGEPLVIFISSPTINSIKTFGMGDWCLKGKVMTDNLVIDSEGIGSIHALDLESKRICIKYAGIGDLTVAGKTDLVEIKSDGIGNIDCENLVAKTAMVKSTKLGKVNCFASESIGLFNDGFGEITYHGNPTFKNLQNGGIGKIKEAK